MALGTKSNEVKNIVIIDVINPEARKASLVPLFRNAIKSMIKETNNTPTIK